MLLKAYGLNAMQRRTKIHCFTRTTHQQHYHCIQSFPYKAQKSKEKNCKEKFFKKVHTVMNKKVSMFA